MNFKPGEKEVKKEPSKSVNKTTNNKSNQNKPKNKIKKEKQLIEKNKVDYNIAITEPKKYQRIENEKQKSKKRKLFDKKDVVYNVPLKKEQEKNEKRGTIITVLKEKYIELKSKFQKNKKRKVKTPKVDLPRLKNEKKTPIEVIKNFFARTNKNIKNYFTNSKKRKAIHKAEKELVKNQERDKYSLIYDQENEGLELPLSKDEIREQKALIKKKEMKKKNVFVRLIYEITSNIHILFNAVLILFFIALLIGAKSVDSISNSLIIYVSCLLIFLMIVAISYNRYLSGKIFTVCLCLIMGFAIYRMQYTYDFIRNLNSAVYEYKTYYVVTFNNNQNKSIYNINNKKVGLLKDNCINIERKLDTKLDKVNYIEYDNMDDMMNDFYSQHFRAVLVSENQYKYMQNYINENSREVKILYEFKANAKK